ncbi:hypothetical protein [Enterococcus mundtii]|uniref:Uncharacterized protein n=1 Tax=Enterococcus mundtii TaxID=53346 RepID=A0A242KFV1_ENTMU|nr:hypothetical protein [Enterococcus mundtii]OTP19937.1 hypothetical protein A5802_003341 [Enterococcus mundtii]
MNKKKKYLIGLFLIFTIISAVWFIYQRNQPETQPLVIGNDVKNGMYKKNMTDEEIQESLQKQANQGIFSLEVNTEWLFKDSQTPGFIGIINPKNNKQIMNVSVYKKDDQALLYESGFIKPEQYIDYGTLKQKLPKGEYQALAKVSIFDETGEERLSETSLDINLYIEG